MKITKDEGKIKPVCLHHPVQCQLILEYLSRHYSYTQYSLTCLFLSVLTPAESCDACEQ